MTKFKVGDKVQKINDKSGELFEIIDLVSNEHTTCVVFVPVLKRSTARVRLYEHFNAEFKLYTEDEPLTDLYVLLISSNDGDTKQLFFDDKKSAMFTCLDFIKYLESTVSDFRICENHLHIVSANHCEYALTLNHINVATRKLNHIDPNEIAVTYLYTTNKLQQ